MRVSLNAGPLFLRGSYNKGFRILWSTGAPHFWKLPAAAVPHCSSDTLSYLSRALPALFCSKMVSLCSMLREFFSKSWQGKRPTFESLEACLNYATGMFAGLTSLSHVISGDR